MPTRNAPSALPATLRFMASRVAHRLSGGGATAITDFRSRIQAAATKLGETVVRCDWVTLTPAADWTDTGIDIPPNLSFSLVADGMVHLSRAFDVGFAPKVGLWLRVGDSGEVAKIVGSGSTFPCGKGGRLQLTTKPPGEFADKRGAFDPKHKRDAMTGAFEVAVLQWRKKAAQESLEKAAAVEPDLFRPVLQRLKNPVKPPSGWQYLWRLGEGEIFREQSDDGHSCLSCHTSSDVGILQFPFEQPLTPDTTLSWSWRVDQLPSWLPEHIQATHDYLSIAMEFDNGLDLTWMWSSSLAEGTIFQCPLPWWNLRETHWVLRSGREKLGQWIDEKRSVLDDYRKAIGGPDPKRVVAVWLIANTAFQRGVGDCRYKGIRVTGKGVETVVHS